MYKHVLAIILHCLKCDHALSCQLGRIKCKSDLNASVSLFGSKGLCRCDLFPVHEERFSGLFVHKGSGDCVSLAGQQVLIFDFVNDRCLLSGVCRMSLCLIIGRCRTAARDMDRLILIVNVCVYEYFLILIFYGLKGNCRYSFQC